MCRYTKGHAVSLSMVAFAGLVYAFMWVSHEISPSPEISRLNPNANPDQFWYSMLNTRRERGMEDYKIEGMSEEEIAELGDESYVPPAY